MFTNAKDKVFKILANVAVHNISLAIVILDYFVGYVRVTLG